MLRNFLSFKLKSINDADQYLIKGLMQDGTTLTASLWKKNAFMLFQGNNISSGVFFIS